MAAPRIRPSASGFQPRVEVGDRDLTQYLCALRLLLPDAGLVLSSREPPTLRDGLHRIGITHTSAGSHTEPGGYEHPGEAEEQFEVADTRSPAEVAALAPSDGLRAGVGGSLAARRASPAASRGRRLTCA